VTNSKTERERERERETDGCGENWGQEEGKEQETNRKRKSGITEGGLRMSESQKRENFISSAG